MTLPRVLAVLAAVIVAAMIYLTFTEPAHDIPNNRPAEYYPTLSATPPAQNSLRKKRHP